MSFLFTFLRYGIVRVILHLNILWVFYLSRLRQLISLIDHIWVVPDNLGVIEEELQRRAELFDWARLVFHVLLVFVRLYDLMSFLYQTGTDVLDFVCLLQRRDCLRGLGQATKRGRSFHILLVSDFLDVFCHTVKKTL